jgi:hypothetical protein
MRRLMHRDTGLALRQVADRFHLVLNLRGAVQQELGRRRRFLVAAAEHPDGAGQRQRLPSDVPSSISRVLRRCRQRDPRNWLRDLGDAKSDLEHVTFESSSSELTPLRHSRRRERVAWTSGLMAVASTAALAIVWALRPHGTGTEVHVDIITPPTTEALSLAFSPDGLQIVFSGVSEGQSRLWVRPLDSSTARPLIGTDGGQLPFWSADSRSIGSLQIDR